MLHLQSDTEHELNDPVLSRLPIAPVLRCNTFCTEGLVCWAGTAVRFVVSRLCRRFCRSRAVPAEFLRFVSLSFLFNCR